MFIFKIIFSSLIFLIAIIGGVLILHYIFKLVICMKTIDF
jgi:hypothetical protein